MRSWKDIIHECLRRLQGRLEEDRLISSWMPFLRRNLFEPLYFARSGSPRLTYWREIEITQRWDETRLRDLQWVRLQAMLRFAYANNSFYRARFDAAGLQPEDIRTPEDVSRLPILTKAEIRRHTSEMISFGYQREELLCFKTGGSTGKSLELFITEECSEQRNACARRHDRWTGWEPGEAIGALWGNPKRPHALKEIIVDCLVQPVVFLDTMEFSDSAVQCFAADWQAAQPTLLFGHAHSLYLLATYVCRLGIDTIRPKGILSTSMMLLPHERQVIEDVFRLKVFDRYGCEEVSLIAAECELHQGLHLNIEHLYIEFLREDDTPAAAGEPGRIIVTDLMNRAMPFIRYQVEDVGVPSARRCSCGRGLPLMETVSGRVADFLVTPDGTRVAGVSLIENTLTKMVGIAQMQIVQETREDIRLNVVRSEDYPESTTAELTNYFAGIFGGMCIDIVFVDEILPEKSGKFRFSICRVGASV